MKKFTLIEEDRYIGIDDIGIFFEKDNWPFADIEHLWAIQWRDNGTEGGHGWIEYDSPVPNTPCTVADIQKYITHFDAEYERQMDLKRVKEEEDRKKAISWQDAMRVLEEQMEEMQMRHEETINKMSNEYISADLAQRVKSEYEMTLEELQKRHEESLEILETDHNRQIQRVHDRIAEAHENLFYAANTLQDNIEESRTAFQSEKGYDNITIFDGSVDPSLFDDSVDSSFFDEVSDDSVDSSFFDKVSDDSSLLDNYDTDQFDSKLVDDVIRDFSSLDLSVLDSEFNLELLFEEDPTEQVVNDIEELIDEVEKEEESDTK